MPPSKHSIFAPSSMGDKLKCPGRHLATLGMDGGSSPATERGTECHDYAELLLPAYIEGYAIDKADFVEDWQDQCCEDMVKHAHDKYNMLSMIGDTTYHTEAQVSLGAYNGGEFDMEQVYGTNDVSLVCLEAKTLAIIDYKTGVGVKVSPEHNVQLMIYALGALKTLDILADIEHVEICISQPRVNPELKVWRTSADYLIHWLQTELIPSLTEMSKPDAPFVSGKDQCRWCPISGTCTAQRDQLLTVFDTPKAAGSTATLSADEIDALMLRLPEFKQWIGQIESAALGLMNDGQKLPNFKLITGKSNRQWTDKEAAEKFLMGQKLKHNERFKYTLLSPAQAETLLKKNLQRTITKNNFDKLVTKPVGKISYAHRDDPRTEVIIDKTAAFKEPKKSVLDLI